MRLFLSVDLPEATRDRVAELQRRVGRRCAGWRWIRPESVHLTVRFLGEVADDAERSARGGWERAARGIAPFALRPEGLGVFPFRGRPRILWLGVRDLGPGPGLTGLVQAVELAARSAGFPAAEREFRPHLTLARAGRDARPAVPDEGDWADPHPFEVLELTLFRSELLPSGARYTALARFRLEGPPDPSRRGP